MNVKIETSVLSKRIIPIILSIAFFVNGLDGAILNVAIPSMAQALHEPPLILKMAVTSYLLSMGVFIPISAWLADRYGARDVFAVATFFFGVGSLGCGVSHNLAQLVLARILQGIGGAMMMPVGRLIIFKLYPKEKIFKLMSLVAMMGLIGPACGPVLGALFVTLLSWRWIFFVNIPFVLLGILLIACFIPNIKSSDVMPLDWKGFILFGCGVGALGFGFSAIGQQALPVIVELGFLIFGGLAFYRYYHYQKRAVYPFINPSIFSIPSYRIAMIGGAILRLSVSSVSFLMALMCQLVFDLSPIRTAFILMAYPLGLIVSKPFLKWLATHLGLRKLLTYTSIVLSILMLTFGKINPVMQLHWLLGVFFLFGFFVSIAYTSLQTLNLVNATTSLSGQMIGFASTMQQIISSFSIALAALSLQVVLHFTPQHVFSIQGFHLTFILNAVIVFCSAFFFFRLKPEDGVEFTGYHIEK